MDAAGISTYWAVCLRSPAKQATAYLSVRAVTFLRFVDRVLAVGYRSTRLG